MPGISSIKVGDRVPIVLQLTDGATDKYPQASIRDNEDNLLDTLDLVHVASGLYSLSVAYTMPDELYIAISYMVYTDATHTTLSSAYEIDADLFTKYNVSESGWMIKIIKNKKVLRKTVNVWQLIIYDDDDVTPILSKDILDKDGNNISDLEAGTLAQELKTVV